MVKFLLKVLTKYHGRRSSGVTEIIGCGARSRGPRPKLKKEKIFAGRVVGRERGSVVERGRNAAGSFLVGGGGGKEKVQGVSRKRMAPASSGKNCFGKQKGEFFNLLRNDNFL